MPEDLTRKCGRGCPQCRGDRCYFRQPTEVQAGANCQYSLTPCEVPEPYGGSRPAQTAQEVYAS